MNALILVDIQNDFLPGGSLAVPGGDLILPVVNLLTRHFNLVIATQDWHPPDHVSFASNHPRRKPFQKIVIDEVEQVLWPDHCVQGTRGAEFSPDLDLRPVESIFRKGTDPKIDSYSAFFDNARRKSSGLEGYLRNKGVKKIFLAGLAADYGVFYTAVDALSLGFKTVIIKDASKPISEEGEGRVGEKKVREKGGAFILSYELLDTAHKG